MLRARASANMEALKRLYPLSGAGMEAIRKGLVLLVDLRGGDLLGP